MVTAGGHRRTTAVPSLVVALALAFTACAGPEGGQASVTAAAPAAPAAAPAGSPSVETEVAGGAPSPSAPPVDPAPLSVANPVRVSVPSVGIDAALIPLGLAADGSMEVPEDFGLAGWYVDGPEPGEPGASVVVGHVDSYTGPAVFFPLRDVAPGDPIEVALADGSVQRFVVDAVEQHRKDAFPTEAVFGATEVPTLRLVTCGGTFDQQARSYLDNVVVFATQV